MVKLTEVEDEHFTDKPAATKNDTLLASDDDDDYTDTGMALLMALLVAIMTSRRLPDDDPCLSIRRCA